MNFPEKIFVSWKNKIKPENKMRRFDSVTGNCSVLKTGGFFLAENRKCPENVNKVDSEENLKYFIFDIFCNTPEIWMVCRSKDFFCTYAQEYFHNTSNSCKKVEKLC